MTVSERTACGSCGAQPLEPVLNLGLVPLANALVAPDQAGVDEPRFPLEVVFCPACALVQITESAPPEDLFRDYPYFSSNSDAFVEHAGLLVKRVIDERRLSPSDLVVEVASNDGYLLKHYAAAGVQVLGIDPAQNVVPVAEAAGVPTLCEFFGADVARRLRAEGRRASVMHANNVMAHVPDLNDVMEGIALLLAEDGVAIIETPYVRDLVDSLEFDTIYHEHLFYYSLTSMAAALERNGLAVAAVERIAIHGGSLRIFAGRSGRAVPNESVAALRAEEDALGLATIDYYRDFARRVKERCATLLSMIDGLKADGKRIAAYGAAAKGTVLLNTLGLDNRTIDFVADRSVHKRGLLMPGAHIPIVGPDQLAAQQPDVVLLLAWNFADEILAQQEKYVSAGGRFLVPTPDPRIIP